MSTRLLLILLFLFAVISLFSTFYIGFNLSDALRTAPSFVSRALFSRSVVPHVGSFTVESWQQFRVRTADALFDDALHSEAMMLRFDAHVERVLDLVFPTHDCEMRDLRRLGNDGDGGIWVCGLHRLQERLAALSVETHEQQEAHDRQVRLYGKKVPMKQSTDSPVALTLSRVDDYDASSPSLSFAFSSMYDVPCLVYSMGDGDGFAFERDLHARVPSCQLHAFQCSAVDAKAAVPEFINVHRWCPDASNTNAAADESDGTHSLFIDTLLAALHHQHLTMLKLDAGGLEFLLLPRLLQRAPRALWPKQIVWTMHLRPRVDVSSATFKFDPLWFLRGDGRHPASAALRLLRLLSRAGYRLVALERRPDDRGESGKYAAAGSRACVEFVHVLMPQLLSETDKAALEQQRQWDKHGMTLPLDISEWLQPRAWPAEPLKSRPKQVRQEIVDDSEPLFGAGLEAALLKATQPPELSLNKQTAHLHARRHQQHLRDAAQHRPAPDREDALNAADEAARKALEQAPEDSEDESELSPEERRQRHLDASQRQRERQRRRQARRAERRRIAIERGKKWKQRQAVKSQGQPGVASRGADMQSVFKMRVSNE